MPLVALESQAIGVQKTASLLPKITPYFLPKHLPQLQYTRQYCSYQNPKLHINVMKLPTNVVGGDRHSHWR
jgi:hypothetical protein